MNEEFLVDVLINDNWTPILMSDNSPLVFECCETELYNLLDSFILRHDRFSTKLGYCGGSDAKIRVTNMNSKRVVHMTF
jgi:hypothetical protein